MRSWFLDAVIRIVVPVQILLSIFFLLRGHNLPGGGFIGGLILASGISFYVLVMGKDLPGWLIQFDEWKVISFGLFLSCCSGLYGLLFSEGFLHGVWGPGVSLPFIGLVKVSTILFFDLGVYLLVGGMVVKLVRLLQREFL